MDMETEEFQNILNIKKGPTVRLRRPVGQWKNRHRNGMIDKQPFTESQSIKEGQLMTEGQQFTNG